MNAWRLISALLRLLRLLLPILILAALVILLHTYPALLPQVNAAGRSREQTHVIQAATGPSQKPAHNAGFFALAP